MARIYKLCVIRPIVLSDVQLVYEIECRNFPTPWNKSIFEAIATWGGKIRFQNHRVLLMRVLESEHKLVGYIVWEENKIAKKGHIMNLAVSEEYRRRGWGEKLLRYALDMMRAGKMLFCVLEVRESNLSAQKLYEKIGMKKKERIEDYYEQEDAILYYLSL
ncbi:MAG: ribosomal-protein-alanine N-acetyltransferase [Candidatus Lokiarchaeota archaeon]|nr:ribosomal-protein-alanine N-acetyltransferase [Candidatus Lokiarchaeota archaeon]